MAGSPGTQSINLLREQGLSPRDGASQSFNELRTCKALYTPE